MLGGPNMKPGLKPGIEYIYEANNMARSVPIGIAVTNDSEDRIKSAFASVLSNTGFVTGNRTRYVINAKINLAPDDPNQFRYTRFVLIAELTDTSTNTILFPFKIEGREGHNSQSGADNRAIREAEMRIKAEYHKVLLDYLSGSIF
jgi:hypothetical protein